MIILIIVIKREAWDIGNLHHHRNHHHHHCNYHHYLIIIIIIIMIMLIIIVIRREAQDTVAPQVREAVWPVTSFIVTLNSGASSLMMHYDADDDVDEDYGKDEHNHDLASDLFHSDLEFMYFQYDDDEMMMVMFDDPDYYDHGLASVLFR